MNGRKNLVTPKLKAAVASMTEEQKDDACVFLECNTRELGGLSEGQGMQAVANVCILLYYLPKIEHNARGNPVRVAHKSLKGVAPSLLPKFNYFLGKVKKGFKFVLRLQYEAFKD